MKTDSLCKPAKKTKPNKDVGPGDTVTHRGSPGERFKVKSVSESGRRAVCVDSRRQKQDLATSRLDVTEKAKK